MNNEPKDSFLIRLIKSIYKAFKEHIIFFIFTSGLIFLILSLVPYRDISYNNNSVITGTQIQNVLITLGTILISSGAFSAVTKSRMFIEIFKNTLQEIVYQEKFIKNQKNIDQIWETITKSLCDQNFEGLSDKIFANIKKNYLPINNDFYYDDYHINIIIEQDSINEDYIIIKEETTCIINTKNKKDEYSFSSKIKHEDIDSDLRTSHEIEFISINGIEQKHSDHTKKEVNQDKLSIKGTFPLSNSTKYSIKRKEIKKYNYKINPNRIQTAIKLYTSMKISIHYPNTFEIDFYELGTTEKWKRSEVKELNGTRWLTVESNNLIFVNQGYLLNFRKM